MSTYEHESGVIKIPAKAWPTFRRNMIKAWNDQYEILFRCATKVVQDLRKAGKGKRNFDFKAAWHKKFDEMEDKELLIHDQLEIVKRLAALVDGKPSRLPQKKDLPLKPISRGATLQWEEACLVLVDSRREMRWGVSENNHACDNAWDHPMGKILDQELKRITWTRGSGGVIEGNDEYNVEAGCGSYTKREYSEANQKAQKEQAGRYDSGYGGYGGGSPYRHGVRGGGYTGGRGW